MPFTIEAELEIIAQRMREEHISKIIHRFKFDDGDGAVCQISIKRVGVQL